jgi:hypothetical protein
MRTGRGNIYIYAGTGNQPRCVWSGHEGHKPLHRIEALHPYGPIQMAHTHTRSGPASPRPFSMFTEGPVGQTCFPTGSRVGPPVAQLPCNISMAAPSHSAQFHFQPKYVQYSGKLRVTATHRTSSFKRPKPPQSAIHFLAHSTHNHPPHRHT